MATHRAVERQHHYPDIRSVAQHRRLGQKQIERPDDQHAGYGQGQSGGIAAPGNQQRPAR